MVTRKRVKAAMGIGSVLLGVIAIGVVGLAAFKYFSNFTANV